MKSKTILKNVSLPPGVHFIRTVYLIYAVLGTIVLLLSLFVIDGRGMQWLQWVVSITFIWVILYGIFKIKSWVVALVLIYASLAFIAVLLKFFEFNPETVFDVIRQTLLLLPECFFVFQIIIFSKRETKQFFKEKEATFIA